MSCGHPPDEPEGQGSSHPPTSVSAVSVLGRGQAVVVALLSHRNTVSLGCGLTE